MKCLKCHRRMKDISDNGLTWLCRNSFCPISLIILAASYDKPKKKDKE